MNYVKASGSVVDQYPYGRENLRADNPNTAFPRQMSDEKLAEYGIYPVFFTNQPFHDEKTQKLVKQTEPTLIDGRWELGWDVVDKTQQEIEDDTLVRAIEIRQERNAKLTECDWTQLADNRLTAEQKAAWTVYRDALRDLPNQAGFPWDVVWPTQP